MMHDGTPFNRRTAGMHAIEGIEVVESDDTPDGYVDLVDVRTGRTARITQEQFTERALLLTGAVDQLPADAEDSAVMLENTAIPLPSPVTQPGAQKRRKRRRRR